MSRRWLAIIMAIVAFGLIGPLAFISQEDAQSNTTSPAATPTPAAQPVVLGQVLEYTADVEAEIAAVQPVLVAVLYANLTKSEMNATLSGLANATLYTLEGSNPYTASLILENATLVPATLGQLAAQNITIIQYALPAEIILPESFIAYRNGIGTTMSLGANDQLSALVSGRTLSGKANFTLEITKSGNTKKIVAFEKA